MYSVWVNVTRVFIHMYASMPGKRIEKPRQQLHS